MSIEMKPILMKDLEGYGLPDLMKKREEYRKELFQLQMKNAMKSLKQSHHIRILRKNIARINTALTSKQNMS